MEEAFAPQGAEWTAHGFKASFGNLTLLDIVNPLLGDLSLLIDARGDTALADNVTTHTVVIGGGTVGLFLAIQLGRANIPVLVVEAGGRVAETLLRSAENAGRTHLGTKVGRAFGLGGTSTLWGGQLGEFDAADLVKPGRNGRWHTVNCLRSTSASTERLGYRPSVTGNTEKSLARSNRKT